MLVHAHAILAFREELGEFFSWAAFFVDQFVDFVAFEPVFYGFEGVGVGVGMTNRDAV